MKREDRSDPAADQGAIDDEVRFHLEGRVEELKAAGLPEADARRRALEAFGDVDAVRAELRTIGAERRRRRREITRDLLRDVRMGARRLRRSPGYSVIAVLTLALGIGASVGMFTVLNAVVLRPLPYPEPDRLVRVWPSKNFNITLSRDVVAAMPAVAVATGISHWGLTLTGEGDATQMRAAVVDATYFDVFGVRPILGRTFTAEETERSRSGVVLLGESTWRGRFGADPNVIGRRIRLNGYDHETREVIGVLPAAHRTMRQDADVWIPLHIAAGTTFINDSTWYVNELVGRLAPGATVERVDADMRGLAQRLRADLPSRFDEETVASASAVSLLDAAVGDVRRTLWTLFVSVGLVLLIACGNLANLLLARTAGQRRDLSVQAAMGASRFRLVRQQLAESALLAAVGGVLGVVIAQLLLAAISVSETSGLPRAASLSIDWRVLGFAFVLSGFSLLLFGLLPAMRATSLGAGSDLATGTRGGSRDRGAHRLNRALVSIELALATVLTTAAGLVLSSFVALRSVDPGVDASDVLAVQITAPPGRYTGESHIAYYQQVTEQIAALPGVTAVGAIHLLPFTLGNWTFPYLAEGQTPSPDAPLPTANFRMVSAGYLESVDQPLIAGRNITDADRDGTPRVVLINEQLAESLWPGEEAIGREIRIFGNMSHRVVGVVGDVHQFALDLAPEPEMYVSHAQWTRGGASMEITVEGPDPIRFAPAVRSIIAGIDPDVPITEVRSLESALGDSLARRRFVMLVLVAFGALALVLGGIGVYGVMSHMVGARMSDFGLRMALGASPRAILRQAIGSGLTPMVVGIGLGLAGSLAAGRLLQSMLFGVPPFHLPTYAAVLVVLASVSVAANWIPARRAAGVDPLEVLRAE